MPDITDKQKAFEFQLDILKKELDVLNSCIDKIDTLTQGYKYWTIGLWSGSIILALGKDATDFKGKFLLTAIIPILFWVLDAGWRGIQRRFIYRTGKISNFINSPNYLQSFETKEIIGLKLYDLTVNLFDDDDEKNKFKQFISFKKTFRFKTVAIFYLGLILISIGLYFYK